MTNSTNRTRLHRQRQREKLETMESALKRLGTYEAFSIEALGRSASAEVVARVAYARQALSQGKTGI